MRERGSAVVEFTFLAVLLLVPLVYFIITAGQVQGASFAVAGAADQAAKVFVAQPAAVMPGPPPSRLLALPLPTSATAWIRPAWTPAAVPLTAARRASTVTFTVRLTVPLPFIPFNNGLGLHATEVQASSTQMVGRFR